MASKVGCFDTLIARGGFTRDSLKTPLQIFVGVAGTSFLYMFSLPYNGLKQRGIWVTISLVMILEPSMGATWKKGPMRVIGTGIGGCVGAFVMACAHAAAGGNDAAWQDRSGPAKIICTTLLLAFSCSLLQLLRLIDPPRDPAYTVGMVTAALASLSDYYTPLWKDVLQNVFYRAMTVALGVGICSVVSLVVTPVHATAQCRTLMAKAFIGAANCVCELAEGFLADDAALRSKAPAVKKSVTDLTAALDKLKAQLPIAFEERHFHRHPMDPKAYTAATGRLRRVHTSMAVVLGRMVREAERSPEATALSLCALLSEEISAASKHLKAAGAVLSTIVPPGRRGWAPPAANDVAAALCDLDLAVTNLENRMLKLQPDSVGAGASAAQFLALGNITFLFIDTNAQLKAAAADILPEVAGAMAARTTKKTGGRMLNRLASTMVVTSGGGDDQLAAFNSNPLEVMKPNRKEDKLFRRLLGKVGVSAGMLKTPTQIFIAVVVSTLIFTVREPYDGLKGRGLWTVITCVMVLEASFGATIKKGPFRIFGTGLGGCCAAVVMGITHAVVGDARWAERNNVPKALTAALILAAAVASLQLVRFKDPKRDYLYFVAEVTAVLASLMDYYEPRWTSVYQNVFWRAMTISLGVAICGVASLLFFPILTSHLCHKALSRVVILNGLSVSTILQGFLTSTRLEAAKLKATQAELAKAVVLLDKLKVWIGIAALEAPMMKHAIDEPRWTLACSRMRRMNSVAQGTLHQMELRKEHLDMCDRHKVVIGRAMDQLRIASYAMGAIPSGTEEVTNVLFELGMLQLYVDMLARMSRGSHRLLYRNSGEIVETDQPGRVPGISSGDILALGHCHFLVADSLDQFKHFFVDLCPEGEAALHDTTDQVVSRLADMRRRKTGRSALSDMIGDWRANGNGDGGGDGGGGGKDGGKGGSPMRAASPSATSGALEYFRSPQAQQWAPSAPADVPAPRPAPAPAPTPAFEPSRPRAAPPQQSKVRQEVNMVAESVRVEVERFAAPSQERYLLQQPPQHPLQQPQRSRAETPPPQQQQQQRQQQQQQPYQQYSPQRWEPAHPSYPEPVYPDAVVVVLTPPSQSSVAAARPIFEPQRRSLEGPSLSGPAWPGEGARARDAPLRQSEPPSPAASPPVKRPAPSDTGSEAGLGAYHTAQRGRLAAVVLGNAVEAARVEIGGVEAARAAAHLTAVSVSQAMSQRSASIGPAASAKAKDLAVLGAAIAARAVLTAPVGGASWSRAAGVDLAVVAATEAARQLRDWVPELTMPQRTLVSWALLAASEYGEPVPSDLMRQLNVAAGDEGQKPRGMGAGSPESRLLRGDGGAGQGFQL